MPLTGCRSLIATRKAMERAHRLAAFELLVLLIGLR
jgi:hypothetical protein